jgi:flagellar hook-basal body complex protein FliE
MSIQTIGGMNSILKKAGAEEWVSSTNLEGALPPVSSPGDAKSSKSFTEFLADSISSVNDLQSQANKAIEELVTGKSKNIHETMLAVEKAEIAFKTMNQVRQKVIDAYKEIMRMQV